MKILGLFGYSLDVMKTEKSSILMQQSKAKEKMQRYLKQRKRELDLGIFIEHSKISVNEYLDKWFEVSAKPDLKIAHTRTTPNI